MDLPADAGAQSIECRSNKPRTWVRIPTNVKFLFGSFAFFLLCYPCEVLESPILTRVCII